MLVISKFLLPHCPVCPRRGACMVGGGVYGRGGMHGGGMHGWGGVVGVVWWGHAWQGACMVGDMHGRRDGHCNRWYASYWNAFLFIIEDHVTTVQKLFVSNFVLDHQKMRRYLRLISFSSNFPIKWLLIVFIGGKDIGGSFQLSLCQELDLRHVHFNVKERKEENPLNLIEHSSSSHGIHFYVFVLFIIYCWSIYFHFCHVFIYLLMAYFCFS